MEKDKISVSVEEDGTVVMLLAGRTGSIAWTGNPDRARWLAQELVCAADRAEGRIKGDAE